MLLSVNEKGSICGTFISDIRVKYDFINPYITNGLAHHYHLGESTLNFRGIRSNFEFLFHFLMKFL